MSDQTTQSNTKNLNKAQKKGSIASIREVIEQKINPYLALHQGSAEFIDFEDGIVTIRLQVDAQDVHPPNSPYLTE